MRQQRLPSFRIRLVTLFTALGCALVLVACGTNAVGQPVVAVPDGDPVVGKVLLERYACVTCHVIPGVRGPKTYVGPPLNAWADREYIAGNLVNDPDMLVDWIVNPQAIEPGTVMPVLGVTPEEARDMAAYLFTLTEAGTLRAEAPATDRTAVATGVTVEMIDIAFRPNELTIPANADVNLHLTNQGVIPHNFKIDDPEIFSGDVAPGVSVDLTLNLPSGAYEYYCTIPGHREAGMVGALTVE